MEKELNRLLRYLRMEYALLWIGVGLLVLLYETDCLPQGVLIEDAQADYAMQVAGILLAVSMIPISLRLFSLSLTRYVQHLSLPGALKVIAAGAKCVWHCCLLRRCLISRLITAR